MRDKRGFSFLLFLDDKHYAVTESSLLSIFGSGAVQPGARSRRFRDDDTPRRYDAPYGPFKSAALR
jgi:hypothetical protein